MAFDRFLQRIGLTSLPAAPLERLRELHRAMVLRVPFENLAILEGCAISLEPADILAKVVERGRGGYCFELNSLFAWALETLGYSVERLLGRVWVNGAPAPLPTHMAIRVTVAGTTYLCDAGFGGGTLREPLPWRLEQPFAQGSDTFRLTAAANGETMLARLSDNGWRDLYSLLPCTVRSQDYIPANHYTSTHPDSIFTQLPMAALNREDGRVTLRGRTLRIVEGTGEREVPLQTITGLVQALEDYFGLAGLDVAALEARLQGVFAE
ncbi:arylamine N-acetyltransferase [Geobacter sp. FeAm09]|uniref:arylamine N-acetyltransferase family protein n=1 Tax=Geobacter sp. FeAm09 TaxID=2597769 RepID=UPI0011EBC79A|nr:arylamine N-acetyltransferase [Geobacter sp. FeAm09]QEM69989.1 arylamine N-acetyltransferase [Geobacter sp. FeAm09]